MIRRVLTPLATCVVAIVVALVVPVSQLRTIDVISSCCCPDPDNCHCPDHQQVPGSKPTSIGVCHRSQAQIVSPEAPVFVAPELALAAPPARAAEPVVIALADPHAAPPAAQPAAPS